MIFRMIYLSTANGAPEPEELEALMARAQANNIRDGITGLAAYHDFTFIQVLEGDEGKVRACFERIKNSDLHRNINIAMEAQSEIRLFETYSMAFVPIDETASPESQAFANLRSIFDGDIQENLQKDAVTAGFLNAFRDTLRGI